MWKVYKWDGHYIQGEFLSKHSTEKAALTKAKKKINYSKAVKSKLIADKQRGEVVIWLDREDGTPMGLIVNKTRKKKGDAKVSTE